MTKANPGKRKASLAATANRGPANGVLAEIDSGVMISALLLISFGVVMIYSTTATLALEEHLPPLFIKHMGALVVGATTGLVCFFVPIGFWRKAAAPLWLASVGLLVAVEFAGIEVNGARRWLAMPGLGFRFQPVEISKFATVIAVAAIIARREGHEELSGRRALAALVLTLPPALLLVAQPDLGNAVLLAVLVAMLVVVAGTRLARLVIPVLVGAAAVGLYIVQNNYAWRRITGFLDPWATSQDEGFQLVQSFVAFGRGGLLGVGLGSGHQKLSYLPDAHTDFILSLVAEELGLVGALAVLGSFAALLLAGTSIARRARDRFALLLAFGMTMLLTLPAIVNASVVMGLLPTKGLPLPFLSYGRTSLVMACAVLGLLLGVGRRPSASTAPRKGARPWR